MAALARDRFFYFAFATLVLCAPFGVSKGLAHPAEADANRLSTIAFTADNGSYPNPERGFYKSATVPLQELTRRELRETFAQGHRLMYVRIDLDDFRDRPLSEQFLAKLDRGFERTRAEGLKLIIRPVYNYPHGETDYAQAEDASLDRVLQHIEQLKPVLRKNADVIAFLQAGFVGAWGEWHTSSNELTAPAAREAILSALTSAAPPERFVQLRYPPYIEEWMEKDSAASASASIGFHNDCFLASPTDVGTFSEDEPERERQRAAMARLANDAPFGGETCNPLAASDPQPRASCTDILAEGAMFGLTYLNAGYYRPIFHERWEREGCIGTVADRMGYRLSLKKMQFPSVVRHGDKGRACVLLANSGWARMYNPKNFQLVLENRRTVKRVSTTEDSPNVSEMLPGQEGGFCFEIAADGSLPAGDYDLYLALRDGSASLSQDTRYSVRFANADDRDANQWWDESQAAFHVGAIVRVDD
ncbi:DUF4874 domain-containing protein [Citromicrobium bathyomarinum]|uniref:DUF4874 domain-containing protein n=1 Tax=Citromicrobium bathyomarinum TaxID=72174 RepID=UPI00315A61FF